MQSSIHDFFFGGGGPVVYLPSHQKDCFTILHLDSGPKDSKKHPGNMDFSMATYDPYKLN